MTDQTRLVIIADNAVIGGSLQSVLNAVGVFAAVTYITFDEIPSFFTSGDAADVVLVVRTGAPESESQSRASDLALKTDAPIVVLRSAPRDPADNPSAGADDLLAAEDIISGPISVRELLTRLRAALDKPRVGSGAEGDIGAYRFDPARRELIHKADDVLVRLTEKEAQVLEVLLSSDGEVVPREVLLDRVWGYGENIETHTLETHIYRLRQKLGSLESEDDVLVSDAGGYRLRTTWSDG